MRLHRCASQLLYCSLEHLSVCLHATVQQLGSSAIGVYVVPTAFLSIIFPYAYLLVLLCNSPEAAQGNLTGLVDSVVTPNGMYGKRSAMVDAFCRHTCSTFQRSDVFVVFLLRVSINTGDLNPFFSFVACIFQISMIFLTIQARWFTNRIPTSSHPLAKVATAVLV